MDFNPYRASETPRAPNVSFDIIQRLLAGGQQGISDALSSLSDIGKLGRSGDVLNLISSGALGNLNEQQAQAKILETAKGSVNQDTQSAIDALLGIKREDKRNEFDLSKIGIQNENDIKKLLLSDELLNKREDKKMSFEEKENEKNRVLQSNLSASNKAFELLKLDKQYERGVALETLKASLKANDNKATDDNKLSEIDKLIINKFPSGIENLPDPVQNTVDFFARSGEGFFDTNFNEMEDFDRKLMNDVVTKVVSSGEGLKAGKLGAGVVKDQIDKELKNTKTADAPLGYVLDYRIIPSNLLPFGKSPSQPYLRPRTKDDK